MTLPRMSHSKYEDYSSCGEMFRLKRVERVPKTPSIFAVAGTAFHKWADWYDSEDSDDKFDGGIRRPDFVNEGYFTSVLTETVANDEEKSGFPFAEWDTPDKRPNSNQIHFDRFRDELGPAWLKRYAEWRTESGWSIATYEPTSRFPEWRAGIELEVRFTIGGIEEIAYVDRLFFRPGYQDVVVIDLKTWSKRRVTPQLATYVVALRQVGINVSGAGYYEARKGEVTKLDDYRYWDEKRLAALHEQAAHMIRAGYFLPRPSADCAICSVSKHCAFAL